VYTSGLAYFNHSGGLTNNDLKALFASATEDCYGGSGILIPARNTRCFNGVLIKALD
jgi:hypothetical protein